MLYRVRRRLAYWRFNQAIRGVLGTPPLPRSAPRPWTIVSMVANDDVPMYILAIKAFCARLGGGRVAALAARDMPEASRGLLVRHVPGIELICRDDLLTYSCQRGACWERLIFCLDRAEQGEYVIQMDADTLAVGADLDEVHACVEARRPFTMTDGNAFVSLAEAAALAKTFAKTYVGDAFEAEFDRFPDPGGALRYIRGSAAFTGFAPGGFARARIEAFHAEGERLLGARWAEWGTEQCASNFAIANSPGAVALPYPAYANHYPGLDVTGSKFLHFFGSERFAGGVFAEFARRELARLGGAGSAPAARAA